MGSSAATTIDAEGSDPTTGNETAAPGKRTSQCDISLRSCWDLLVILLLSVIPACRESFCPGVESDATPSGGVKKNPRGAYEDDDPRSTDEPPA
jgi:hypothetical protein